MPLKKNSPGCSTNDCCVTLITCGTSPVRHIPSVLHLSVTPSGCFTGMPSTIVYDPTAAGGVGAFATPWFGGCAFGCPFAGVFFPCTAAGGGNPTRGSNNNTNTLGSNVCAPGVGYANLASSFSPFFWKFSINTGATIYTFTISA